MGTKHDLMFDFNCARSGAWARELGATSYHEVSSATGYCVFEVFDEAVRAALGLRSLHELHIHAKKRKKKNKCVLV